MNDITPDYKEQSIEPHQSLRLEDLSGSFPYVTSAPTWTPKTFQQSLAIYNSSGTLRLYIYDKNNAAWRYASLT